MRICVSAVLIVSLIVSLAACASPPATPARSARTCESCHADVAAAYAKSRHFAASTNASYLASVAHSPDAPWCASCHGRNRDERVTSISCTACHTGEHHAKVDVATTCAKCHAVPLPPAMHAGVDAPLAQITPSESTAACTRCHADHALPAGHDEKAAASAVDVDVARIDRVAPVAGADGVDVDGGVDAEDAQRPIAVTITVAHAGHPVPTGDPFRTLTIHACEDPECEFVVDTRHLGRAVIADRASEGGWRVVDKRPKPGVPARVLLRDASYVEVLLESTERTPPPEEPVLITRVAVP